MEAREIEWSFLSNPIGWEWEEFIPSRGKWWKEETIIWANRALQEIYEYLSKAEKMKGGIRDDMERNRITAWIDKARILAFSLEDKIDASMLPPTGISRDVNLVPFCCIMPRALNPASRETSANTFQHIFSSQSWKSTVHKLVEETLFHLQKDQDLFSQPSHFVENVSYIENSPPLLMDMVGMEGDVAAVEQHLEETGERTLIFITGEGGAGKTALAQKVYTSNKHKFVCQSWVHVYRSREHEVLRRVLEGFHTSISDEFQGLSKNEISVHELREEIRKICRGRSYFLVFDDVRDLNAWNWIKQLLPARTVCTGKIIFTVRNEELSRQIDEHEETKTHKLGKLHEADARKLLRGVALPQIDLIKLKEALVRMIDSGNLIKEILDVCDQNELAQGILSRLIILNTESSSMQILDQLKLKINEMTKIELDILGKCNGNPLAIRAIGGLLKSKHVMPESWQEVLTGLDDILNRWRENIIIEQSDDIQSTPADPFVLSGYANLPPYLQFCFLYCGGFPDSENFEIPRKKLIRLWSAEGFVQEVPGKSEEEVADQQLAQLINREMLHVVKRGLNGEVLSCQILSPVRRIALSICQKQNFCEVLPKNNINLDYCHRVSIHEDSSEVSKVLHHAHRLRSLLFFGTGKVQHLFKHHPLFFISRYKLLRVLELMGIELGCLPEAVECLALLRYLGLRKTGLRMLPRSLRKLKFLKSLDIRDTYIGNIYDVRALQSLRHLHLASSSTGRAVCIRRGLVWLVDLRTLAGVAYSEVLYEALRPLIELRKLAVMNAFAGSITCKDNYKTPDYCAKLCSSINRMILLQSLTITCERDSTFDLSYLYDRECAPLDHLRTVKLGGEMIGLLDRISRIQSIAYLYLWDNKLKEDPLLALGGLPKLALLSFYSAYEGTNMRCNAGGYQKLKKLSIVSMGKLEKWDTIEKGAMPVLEKLFIGYCPKLKRPPEGLEELRSLHVIQIAQMPKEFEEIIKREEQHINCKVKCIPLHR